MALCSDNGVLSGLLRLFCSGAHWQAYTAPSGERLKRGGESRKGGGGGSVQDRFRFSQSSKHRTSSVTPARATVADLGLGSGGNILLFFHGGTAAGEKMKPSEREEEKKMEGEGGIGLWFLTRSREEIPACTLAHTGAKTLRADSCLTE